MKTYSDNVLTSIQYYIWKNSKLMGYFNEDKISDNDTTVKMLYDNNDELIGFRLVNEQIRYDKILFFRKNLQGDILSVCDSFGNQVLTYSYDAWGNVNVTANTDDIQCAISASMAIEFVPITYRGYLYDSNTGLYYLQSRYYNPTYGRFLNADSIMKTGEPLGANIFAYCGNNPVNYVDYDGRDARDAISIVTKLLQLLVVVVVMQDSLGALFDFYDFIINDAQYFEYQEETSSDMTFIVATFVHNDEEENYESYKVYITLAHWYVWEYWANEPFYESFWEFTLSSIGDSLFGMLPLKGKISLLVDASVYLVNMPKYIKRDYIKSKINSVKENGGSYLAFVTDIEKTHITILGNKKSILIYKNYFLD